MDNRTDLEVDEQDRPEGLADDVRLRWVPGYEGEYAVTNNGGVWTWKESRWYPDPPSKMSPARTGNGYELAQFSGQEVDKRLVHRLVLRCFDGPCPDGQEARHLNGNRADNRIENLEWATHEENMSDTKRHGTFHPPPDNDVRGEKSGRSKLTEDQAREIRRRWNDGENTSQIADDFEVSDRTVADIGTGRSWGHLDLETSTRRSVLSESEVVQIRRRYDTGDASQPELAEEFSKSREAIRDVVKGRTFHDVGGPTQ